MGDKVISYIKTYKYFFAYAAIMPMICLALLTAAKTFPAFAQFYSENIFQFLPNVLGRIMSLFPFSVFEFLLYFLFFGCIILAISLLKNIFSSEGRRKSIAFLPKFFVFLACFASTVFIMVILACAMNYYRDGIAKDIGMSVGSSNHESLISLCLLLIDDVNEITADEEFLSDLDRAALHRETKDAMKNLGLKYDSLDGYYPNPKAVALSSHMSDLNLTGIFSPCTIEANYNKDVASYIIPYTICHELAHLKGYIREDEAGFIAYLACASAEDPDLQYSAALNALNYVLNALYKDSNEDEYQEILQKIPKTALEDLIENQEYWKEHRNKVSEISTAANDLYLKANAQEGGIKSYGRMVDLLLAYYDLNVVPDGSGLM